MNIIRRMQGRLISDICGVHL